jgi:hypothetical protein
MAGTRSGASTNLVLAIRGLNTYHPRATRDRRAKIARLLDSLLSTVSAENKVADTGHE